LRYIDKEKVELYLISSSEIAPYYVGLVPEERVLVLGRYFDKHKNTYLYRALGVLKRKLRLNEKKLCKWAKRTEAFLDKNSIQIIHAHLVWDYWIASKIKETRLDIKCMSSNQSGLFVKECFKLIQS